MTEASNRSAGFTLLELMAAMGIFVFGLTALIGVLTIGVGTRRGAEMRTRAVLLADRVLHRIETETLVTAALPHEFEDDDLAIERVEQLQVDGFPGMKYSVEFEVEPELPELVLVRIRVSWLEEGEDRAQEFVRILPREVPFSRRVAERRRQR